jgi:hypothetical protein
LLLSTVSPGVQVYHSIKTRVKPLFEQKKIIVIMEKDEVEKGGKKGQTSFRVLKPFRNLLAPAVPVHSLPLLSLLVYVPGICP